MSSESASVMGRFGDLLRKYLRRLPSVTKLVLYYDVGQSFERGEKSFASYVLELASRLNKTFTTSEGDLYKYYKSFAKDLLDLTSAVEDALSFTSLYMNLLVIFALLLMVFWAWTL